MQLSILGRIAVTTLLIAIPLGIASTADMPVRAPMAAPPPAFDWNGFYAGVFAGAVDGSGDHFGSV